MRKVNPNSKSIFRTHAYKDVTIVLKKCYKTACISFSQPWWNVQIFIHVMNFRDVPANHSGFREADTNKFLNLETLFSFFFFKLKNKEICYSHPLHKVKVPILIFILPRYHNYSHFFFFDHSLDFWFCILRNIKEFSENSGFILANVFRQYSSITWGER